VFGYNRREMAIRHACFISHCHGHGELMTRFIADLEEALTSSLDPYMKEPVFIDRARLQPGYRFNPALATAICESLCMVAVLVPRYFESSYCLCELEAMKRIEDERFTRMGRAAPNDRGLIVPILLRGTRSELPESISGHIHYSDFHTFSPADRRIVRTRQFSTRIDDIARFIFDLRKSFVRVAATDAVDCTNAALPATHETARWVPDHLVADPMPFREAER
jgi:TIR domain